MIDLAPGEDRIKVSIGNKLEELHRLHETAHAFAVRNVWPPTLVEAVELVLEEVDSNVIKYAFDDDAGHDIDVQLTSLPGEAVICVEDDGHPFDPVAATEPDDDVPIDPSTAKRFGLHLVREVAQMLTYRRENGRNILEVHLGMPAE